MHSRKALHRYLTMFCTRPHQPPCRTHVPVRLCPHALCTLVCRIVHRVAPHARSTNPITAVARMYDANVSCTSLRRRVTCRDTGYSCQKHAMPEMLTRTSLYFRRALQSLRAVSESEALEKLSALRSLRPAFAFRHNPSIERPSAAHFILNEACHAAMRFGARSRHRIGGRCGRRSCALHAALAWQRFRIAWHEQVVHSIGHSALLA